MGPQRKRQERTFKKLLKKSELRIIQHNPIKRIFISFNSCLTQSASALPEATGLLVSEIYNLI